MTTEPRIIKIYETTLRDGEQTPGVNYFPEEKLVIAQALADLGCDTLDCGFPISSPGEFEAVRLIASKVENAEILAIGRANPADIERAWEAVKIAAHPAIEPFISVSPLHRQVKLGKTRDEVRELAKAAVAQGRSYTENIDFALEDTTRTEHDFILEICETIMKEGVRFITLCDTVGISLPWEFGKLVADVKKEFPHARISAHCHDDLGLAVANALEGLRNGAERVDICINGLGERAGNAATEEVVMAIRTRSADLGMDVKVDTTKLVPTSRLIAKFSGMQPQWTKSVVGENTTYSLKEAHMTSLADGSLIIQISSESVPSTPSWFGEVVWISSYLRKHDVLAKITQQVRFARKRFGRYDVIDFLAVLFGYALSGERTLEAFYGSLQPFAVPFMAVN